MQFNSAQRRYNRAVLILSLLYAVLLFGAVALFRTRPPDGPLAYLVALLPALPLVAIFVFWARYLGEERDEYVRMLTVRQTLIATCFMLSLTTIWGFLESFDLAPHLPAYWAGILWFAGLGLGAAANILSVRRGRL